MPKVAWNDGKFDSEPLTRYCVGGQAVDEWHVVTDRVMHRVERDGDPAQVSDVLAGGSGPPNPPRWRSRLRARRSSVDATAPIPSRYDRSGSIPVMERAGRLSVRSGRRRADLVLELDERLLADLEEPLARSIEVDDERDDGTHHDDEDHRAKQASTAGEPRAVADHPER
jgi:hypothetical protein